MLTLRDFRSTSLLPFLAFLVSAAVTPALFAQAGSRPPLQFDAAFAYHNAGLDLDRSGHAELSPMVREQVWRLPPETMHLVWVERDRGRLTVLERGRGGSFLPRLRIPLSIG